MESVRPSMYSMKKTLIDFSLEEIIRLQEEDSSALAEARKNSEEFIISRLSSFVESLEAKNIERNE